MDTFASREYTVVGVAASPMYINYERGGTALGNGTVAAFVYLLPEGADYFEEMRGLSPDIWVPAKEAETLAAKLMENLK